MRVLASWLEDYLEWPGKPGDLARDLPTVFAPGGKCLCAILLVNLAHLTNHKHQLFLYLKLCGETVSTRDLYRFEEFPNQAPQKR